MKLSLRRRLVLTLAPLIALLIALGAAGFMLLQRLGGHTDLILRENYDSVRAMFQFNEALKRIDSSFQLALAGKEQAGRKQFDESWSLLEQQLGLERQNITLPGELEMVEQLSNRTAVYRQQAEMFFAHGASPTDRANDYFGMEGRAGLMELYRRMTLDSSKILRMNQENMESASQHARETAQNSQIAFAAAVVAAALLAILASWLLLRSVIRPISDLTDAATAIGVGQLHRSVPPLGNDELGRLAAAFNTMSEQLRHYRQSNADRLLRAQRTSQATIDSFPDPVLVVDPEGRVELANSAAQRVLGVTASGAVWQPPTQLVQPLNDVLRTQQPFLTEKFDQGIFFHIGDEERAYLPQIRPIRDPFGGTLGAAVVLSDVTQFRVLDEVKTNLVATVSHELKTPLTSLRLALHLLLEESVGPLEPKQMELLLDARDNAERLLRTIEQLLALARMEQGRESPCIEPLLPADLLRAAATAAEPRVESKHLRLVVDEADGLPRIAADATRLAAAIDNLIDNAIAFTDSGGMITLRAGALGADRVRFSVIDTGIGIPPEYLPHVFDKFFRVPGVERPGSTGLGLAIVREVIEAQGGEVSVESELGHGTTFHLVLPIWRESDSNERKAHTPAEMPS